MKIRVRDVLLGLLTLAPASGFAQEKPREAASPTSPYDDFMKLPRADRAKRFNDLTADKRATVLKTQAQRWLKKNRSRLTPPQVQIVEEHIGFPYAKFFATPQDPEAAAAFKDLAGRTAQTLSREDSVAALSVLGDYIPPDSVQ